MKLKLLNLLLVSCLCFQMEIGVAAKVPPPPQIFGDYEFHGLVRKLAILHLERVYTLFPEGQQRLQELTDLGYSCESYGSHWTACQKIRHDLDLPEHVIKIVSEPYVGKVSLRFGGLHANPWLIHETEFQWSWQVPQDVFLNGSLKRFYEYVHMDHVEKIFVGDQEFILNDEIDGRKSFSLIKSISMETPDQTGYMTYYLDLVLEYQ